MSTLTAARDFTLRGVTYTPGAPVADAEWLATPERNRRAMVRARFVRSPDLAPSRAELRARQTASPVVADPATLPAPTAVVAKTCDLCHATFTSASALGGHMRGHTKRGEK